MLEQMKETWQALDRRQQISVIAMAVIVVGGLLIVGTWAVRPTWAVLYSELSPGDAQSVIEQLRDQGVPYRLAAGGSTVQVPQNRLYELRLQLAGEGLPTSSTVGFELFDRTSFSSSELQNNVNLQRALQGELERSICTLEEIVSARVHLALPEERLFTESQQQPSASVVVGLAGGRLSTPQVTAISQLVGSAVPGLDADAVTLVDTGGRVLSGGLESAPGLQTMAQIDATRGYEESVRGHLQSMLDSVLGRNRSVVRVQAALDFQQQQLMRETIEPAEGQGVLRREEITRESYEGRGAPGAGGPAGLMGRETAGDAETNTYEHTHEQREYDFSRFSEQTVSPPGRLERLAVAVVIDESFDRMVGDQVRQLVEAAAGIDVERGDVVTVESMEIEAIKIAEEEMQQAKAAEAQRQREQAIQRGLRYGSVIAMLAMVAGAMFMFSRTLGAAGEQEEELHQEQQEDTVPEEDTRERVVEQPEPMADAASRRREAEETLEFSPMTVEELETHTDRDDDDSGDDLVKRLSEFGTRSPEEFAKHLIGWLAAPQAESDEGDDDD